MILHVRRQANVGLGWFWYLDSLIPDPGVLKSGWLSCSLHLHFASPRRRRLCVPSLDSNSVRLVRLADPVKLDHQAQMWTDLDTMRMHGVLQEPGERMQIMKPD